MPVPGAAVALVAAAERVNIISAIVSRGGRPDLAWSEALKKVQSPTLFIVGEKDAQVIEMNENAKNHLEKVVRKKLKIVPGATHLFEGRGNSKKLLDWLEGGFSATSPSKKTTIPIK